MPRYRGRYARTPAGAVLGAPILLTAPAAHAAAGTTWDRVAQCESGGRWSVNTGNGYHGGLQFSPSTWTGFGGKQFAPVAHQASRAEQIVVAERVLAKQGWGAWPVCSRKAGARGEAATQRSAPAKVKTITVSAPGGSGGSYVVKPGDTLSKIASANGVSGGWKALAAKNPGLKSVNSISPGQKLSL